MKIRIHLGQTLDDIPPDIRKTSYVHPEAGLHPTDVMLWLIDVLSKKNDLDIITQTATIVNGLGLIISRQKLSTSDVEVKIYRNLEEVITCSYNEDGVLVNWPFGWFHADEDPIDVALKKI